MSTHPARIFASVLLLGGGLVVGVTALAIGLARVLVDAGAPVRPADAALLADLVPVLPFIVAFSVGSLVAAVGLAGERAWAENLAIGVSIVGVVTGLTGLFVTVAGSDPFASSVSAHATSDGIGIVGAFTVASVAVLAAIAEARQGRRLSLGAAS